jgi:tetratricopeptide (TPR) repeat protein
MAPAAVLAPAPLPPVAVPAGLVVGAPVGVGGFATTWAAELAGAPVILKVAHRGGTVAAMRFAYEHEVLQRLVGTGAPEPIALERLPDGRPYIVMTRTPGDPLAAHLAASAGPWAVAPALALMDALCASLAAVHARRFVHGDLKPENVMVAERGAGAPPVVGLVDFGVARGGDLPAAVPAGVGTIEYMAPEQLREAASDPRADVYAVAAMAFELLAGHPPFLGERSAIAFQLRNERAPRLRHLAAVPVALDELVARCLEKRPADRPADAAALRAALAAARAELVARSGGGAVPAAPAARLAVGSEPGGAPPARPPAAIRTACALVGLEAPSVDEMAALVAGMERHGGALARRRGPWLVFVFEAGRQLLPVRAAATAAAAVVAPLRGATVHVATLSLRRRADGTVAVFGEELERMEEWVVGGAGVAFTDAAAAALAPFALDGRRALVGRAAELAALRDLAAAAGAGRGPALARVLGPPGIGKTQLLEALGAAVLDGATPPRVVAVTARRALLGGGIAGARELLEQLPASGAIDELARAAAAWILDPRRDAAIAPLRAAPGALEAAAARALASGIVGGAARPLVVLIDDAHHVDPVVLAALAAALRAGARSLAVVLAGAPELGASELVAPAVLGRDLELGPLPAAEAAELARALLAPVELIPDSVLGQLVARTQGHPLELIELTGALRRSGAIAQSERGRWELDLAAVERAIEAAGAATVPSAGPSSHLSQWLAEQAFGELAPSLVAHAELVALLGGDASARDVREVIAELDRGGLGERIPLDAERGLELLREAGVLVRAGGSYSFRRARLADVRAGVARDYARAVHGAALAAWTRRADAPPDERLAKMAYHAFGSGRPEQAAPLYRELGERALGRHRYAEAELALTRALAGDSPHPRAEAAAAAPAEPGSLLSAAERGLAHWHRGIARYRLGRHDAASADFAVARAGAHAQGAREQEAAILLDEAMSLDWAMEHRGAARCVAAAAALVSEQTSARVRAALAMSEARTLIRDAREADALAPLERAIALAAPLGDAAYEILVVALLQSAPILATWGRHEEARRAFDQVLALTEAAGDRLHHCAALANRLWRPFATPELAALRRDHARVLAIASELGHFILEFTGEVNFAGALHHLGYARLALEHARRAVELERTRLGDAARPEAALLLARILAAAGDRGAEVLEVVGAIDAHQRAARAAQRTDALLTPGELVLLAGARWAASGDAAARAGLEDPAVLRAHGSQLLPRHELAELGALLAR